MKQEAKKLLAYVMALSVMVSAILSGSLPAQAATLSPTENNNLSISENEDGITVYTLTSNVTDGLSLTLADGETVILDGNNYSISGRSVYGTVDSTPALTLSGNGTLILKNINLSGGNGCPPISWPNYNGSAAVNVDSENVSLILQDTVTMTGGNAGGYDTDGNSGSNGLPGMIFHGDSLIVDSASDVSITGSNGYDGYYSRNFYRPVSGTQGADGLQLSSGSLTVHSDAKLTITGGNGGENTDTRVSSGDGGNALSFDGMYYSVASNAVVTFNAGKAGSITSDSTSDKSGSGGKILSYKNGLFQDQTLLKSALSDDTETVTVKLHYPTETQIWYAKKDTTLNTSKLPDSDYYTVYGCYSDDSFSSSVTFPYTLSEDTELYAKCTPKTFQVSFITDDDSIIIPKQAVTYPASAAEPTGLSKTGYTLDGWYTDKDCTTAYDFSSKVTGDITLYAKWNINSYTVSFDSNGGSSVATQSATYNTAASKPADPSKTGFTFAGWFTDKDGKNAYDFSSKVTGAITLYAKWNINSCTVSFDSNGGSSVAAQSVTYNTAASKPADPSMTGCTFAGWFTDKDCTTAYDFSSKVTGDITLYAKWDKIPDQSFNTPKKYKVSLNASSIPLQKGKSTTAVKATLTKGDSIAKWKSSNKKIATVDKKGKITAKKTGTATITVRTKKGATASVKVKVQKGKVTTKELTITNVTDKKLTLKKGKTFKIKTSVTPITSPDKISYASSNKKIVTVDKKGKLKAVKKGTATITVKSGKKTVKFKVNVKK